METSGWYLVVGVDGEKMVWHVDPGSAQTIVPSRVYYAMAPEERPELVTIGKRFLHAGGKEISPVG